MPLFVVESYSHHLTDPEVRSTPGALGQGGGSEKVCLHVLELSEATLRSLVVRVDEDGNTQSDRLARPRDEDWWISTLGEKTWPGTVRPKVVSSCTWAESGAPVPKPLGPEALAELRRVGALK